MGWSPQRPAESRGPVRPRSAAPLPFARCLYRSVQRAKVQICDVVRVFGLLKRQSRAAQSTINVSPVCEIVISANVTRLFLTRRSKRITEWLTTCLCRRTSAVVHYPLSYDVFIAWLSSPRCDARRTSVRSSRSRTNIVAVAREHDN